MYLLLSQTVHYWVDLTRAAICEEEEEETATGDVDALDTTADGQQEPPSTPQQAAAPGI